MTAWLQDNPKLLRLRLKAIASAGDLRDTRTADEARAIMHAAADMIGREVIGLPMNEMNYSLKGDTVSPLHWSWMDRIEDALACLYGNARVLRRETDR